MTSLLPVEPTPAPVCPPVAALEALPLPSPGWSAADAWAAWEHAASAFGGVLRAGAGCQPVVVSALTTVVLRVGPWAVKVYPVGTDADHLAHVAEALAGSGTALLPVAAPVATPHGVVTVSRWLDAGRPVSWTETGRLLRRFHAEHADAVLPRWQPLSRLPSQAAALPPEAAEVLVTAREELLGALAEVRSELGEGPIHGDVSPVNVLRDGALPRLIDLDWAAVGPREYDLAAAARRARTGEMSRATYRAFCRAYGHDVRRWPGLPVVDRLAELGALVFRIWDCRHHGWPLDWLDAEVAGWRSPL